MSYLHIEVSPADKGRWVACAARDGITLQQWVTNHLNAQSNQYPIPAYKWMRDAGFSTRLSDALILAGYTDPDVLSGCLRQESGDHWIRMENFGTRCLRELKDKWPV